MRMETELGSTVHVVDEDVRLETRRVLADQRWPMYVVLVVFNALDVLTTALVLERGGDERNPFVRPFIDGMWEIALVKGLVLLFIAVLLARCRESRMVELALAATAGWYFAVVMWNFMVLALL